MNIFFLDKTPYFSAQYLCDKHVPKMLLESAQMLSTAIQQHIGELDCLYKSAYPNHPMTKWVGANRSNFSWVLSNALCINREYEIRFKKNHKSYKIIKYIYDNNYIKSVIKKKWVINTVPEGDFTEPPQCMPDVYKDNDYVTAYRNYYKGEKEYFAKWEKGRQQPEWW